MKYSRLSTRMVPSSLQDWLEEELENRGIDGVVYTRYILSLLQDDESNDEIHVNSGLCESSLEANPNFINGGMHHNKRQHKCHSNKWVHRRYQQSNSANGSCQKNKSLKCCECAYDECTRLTNIDQKRSVVVECLKSASEEDFEIESLVDELCAKLEEYKSNMGRNEMDLQKVEFKSREALDEFDSSPKEQANKYYAAFPALNKMGFVDSENEVAEFPVDTNIRKITSDDLALLESGSKWDGRRIIEFAKKDSSLDTSDSSVDDELFESRHCRQMFGLAQKSRNPIEDITNIYNDSNICKIASGSVDNVANVSLKFANTDRFTNSENSFTNFVDVADTKEVKYEYDDEVALNDEWEHEKLKILVAKFNNKIASLWNDEKGACNARRSIWCFDNTNWSPQSSNTPSPKLNECFKNKWFSVAPFDDGSTLWEPLQKHSVSYSIASANDCEVDEWIGVETDKISEKVMYENKTSLSNHGDDSLFVEVSSRRNGSFSDHSSSEKQQVNGYLAIQEQKSEEDESSECLLTSPKTHFQPIKQDSFDDEYEDATTSEADAEVSRLVPCSSICPNNGSNDVKCDNKSQSSQESKNRSLSTSLPELTLFMGPFTDTELVEEKTSIEEEKHSSKACVDCENENGKVTSSSNNEENEFEELCTMLNEVLREDTNSKSFIDDNVSWFDQKEKISVSEEQRSSWNGFWTYKHEIEPESSHPEFFGNNELQQENDFISDGARSNNVESISVFPLVDSEYDECETGVGDKSLEWFSENTTEYLPLQNEAYNASVEWSAGVEYEYRNTMSDECADPTSVFCCWNLEKEWQKEEHEECTVAQQRRVEDYSGKRPCTFFMEGNCRRSDCKFSHDLGNITCKFWEEGCCFKGFLCPFLHGYPSESKNRKVSASNPKFLIESETDFPSLSTGNSEAYLSESSESNVSLAKSKGKRFKQESNVLYRMVKKKRKKAGSQCYNEKAV